MGRFSYVNSKLCSAGTPGDLLREPRKVPALQRHVNIEIVRMTADNRPAPSRTGCMADRNLPGWIHRLNDFKRTKPHRKPHSASPAKATGIRLQNQNTTPTQPSCIESYTLYIVIEFIDYTAAKCHGKPQLLLQAVPVRQQTCTFKGVCQNNFELVQPNPGAEAVYTAVVTIFHSAIAWLRKVRSVRR